MPGFVRYGHIWIIHSLVPLREGIYDSYTPLVIVQEYTQTEHPFVTAGHIHLLIYYISLGTA